MPHFFIERPIFAWVIALFIVLTGLLSILVYRLRNTLKLRHPVLSFQ